MDGPSSKRLRIFDDTDSEWPEDDPDWLKTDIGEIKICITQIAEQLEEILDRI